MEQRADDSALSQSGHPVKPSVNLSDGLNPPETGREDPGRESEGRDGFLGSQLTEGGEEEGGVGRLTPLTGKEMPPSTAGEMDQSKPAEQQGGDLGLTQEKEAKSEEEEEEEERDVEEAVEALEMEDEGEDEEEERQRGRDSAFCREALPVETLASGAEVEAQQEAQAEEETREETQEAAETRPHQEAQLPQEAPMEPQERGGEDEEEEFEYEYEVEQADIIREAASLDDMAKLITVEEISPASGLVSILKKRSVCADKSSVSPSSEPRPDKPAAKRRVRFKVPDDSYEQEVGGGDSCLLLFLLCLVTVVISVGGTALYCALGDAHSTVCQDFSRNADFYIVQIQRGISHIQHWFTPGS